MMREGVGRYEAVLYWWGLEILRKQWSRLDYRLTLTINPSTGRWIHVPTIGRPVMVPTARA